MGCHRLTYHQKTLSKTENTPIFVMGKKQGSDYQVFGMQMPNRNGSDDDSYRYGFNGMEKDDEVKGESNSYTSQFRQYDPRVGRWLSNDPVTHSHFSPYNGFDNNPIVVIDPLGADGGTKKNKENKTYDVDAEMVFTFDAKLFVGMDPNEIADFKKDYIKNFKAAIDAGWNGIDMGKDYTLNTKTIKYSEMPPGGGRSPSEKNVNIINVTSDGQGLGLPDGIISHQIDNVSGNRNSEAVFFASNRNRSVAHEFGHMMGLTDRYYEVLPITNVSSSSNGGKTVDASSRETIPLQVNNDPEYYNNLMATGSGYGVLDDRQLRIVKNRNRFEKEYVDDLFIVSRSVPYKGGGGQLPSGVRGNYRKGFTSIDQNGKSYLTLPQVDYILPNGDSNSPWLKSTYGGNGATSLGSQNTLQAIEAAKDFGWLR